MSSFKNASKARQKTHRERSQPSSRAHLGALEKKKDYKARAVDYQKKQKYLKGLKRKALDRNPDEFYFKMVKTRLEDGVHQTEDTTTTYTEDQLKLMQSQDIKYVNYKRTTEMKKIEKMKSGLHMLDVDGKPKNKHTFFVDSKKDVSKFDAAKHLNTHPMLLERVYNRPTLDTLKNQEIQYDAETLQGISVERKRRYKELATRIEREKELRVTSQKMEVKKQLMNKKVFRNKVQEETKESAAVYQWKPQRKR